MALKILALSSVAEAGKLNTEWLVLKNESDHPFNLEGCSITLAKGSSRPRQVTTFKAGIVIQPQETCRLVSGSSGKKSHGEAPVEDGVRNIPLFMKVSYLDKPGLTVRLMNRQQEVAKATFDPQAECPDGYSNGGSFATAGGGGDTYYYHIVGYTAFTVGTPAGNENHDVYGSFVTAVVAAGFLPEGYQGGQCTSLVYGIGLWD